MTRSTRSRLHLLLVLLLCLVATSACSSAGRPDPDRRATSSAITQGQVDTDGSFRWIARVDTPTGICSGTLISPSVVLTAAHCLENYAQGCGTFRYRQPATYEFHLDPPHTADFRSVIGYLRPQSASSSHSSVVLFKTTITTRSPFQWTRSASIRVATRSTSTSVSEVAVAQRTTTVCSRRSTSR